MGRVGLRLGRSEIGGAEDGDPRVAATRNEPDRPGAGSRDGDRHSRRLHTRRANARLVHGEIGALVRDGRFAEQALDELDELVEPSHEPIGRQRLVAEQGCVESDSARADAER